MAQLSDFISRIFSSDRTQGLSGGAEVVIDQDPASAFYASRLRKHRTDEDLVENPEYLWATASFGGRKGGLRMHVQAERGDGVATFTDVLIVVNQADADRIATSGRAAWIERATRGLAARFDAWCEKEKFQRLHPSRPTGFRFVADGSEEMLGQSFGLGPGEYITGLLPNEYAAPGAQSRAVLAVHLNIPGAWDGYREVGRLYHDQALFTLGRHWLDNYHHPALREPGLYRLQQYPDGSLVHVISPEVQDRFLVRSDSAEGGAAVLKILEWSGEPVAYVVLAVIDEAAEAPAPEPSVPPPAEEARPALDLPATPTTSGVREARAMLQRTIVPGAIEARILTLQERGALLQKVHFANFMEGYDVYLGPGGRIGTQMSDPKAVLQVRGARVSLLANEPGVVAGGRAVAPGRSTPLSGEVVIEVDGSKLLYHDLSGVKLDGWPYLGELRRPGSAAYLEFGGTHRIGRDRRCKVRLPDEQHNDNIAWLPSVGGGTNIRSRTGEIPKSRFYTDSIMVASEHAELDLVAEPVLRSLARHCYTYVRRGGEYFALYPREGSSGRAQLDLTPNDEILIGNCLFQLSYLLPGQSPAADAALADAPRIQLSSAELAGAMDAESPRRLGTPVTVEVRPVTMPPVEEPPSVPAPSVLSSPSAVPAPSVLPPMPAVGASGPLGSTPRLTVDLAPAGGLGEVGAPPRPVVIPEDPFRTPRAPVAPMLIESFEGFSAKPPAAAPEPALPDPEESEDPVVSVDEAGWSVEIARPARLVQIGWMVSGEATVGNHRGAELVVPEVRAFPEQAFLTLDYFRVFARGRKAKVELLQEGEAKIVVDGAEVPAVDDVARATLHVVRRDANLEPDFDITLRMVDAPLPDPRARLLRIDTAERLVAALFTTGFPLRSRRRVRLGPLVATVTFDGTTVRLSDYLASYRDAAGRFRAVFHRSAAGGFHTLPEDGSAVTMQPGDLLLSGVAVYELQVG